MRMIFAIGLCLVMALGVAQAATEDEVKDLISQAEAEREKASKLEYEWRFTGKYIKEAKELLEQGKLDEAMKRAERALFEAKSAQEQHAISEQVWLLSVPR